MSSDKKLNILIFNRWVGYNEGGNETHMKDLALNLTQAGHSVSFLTTGNSALKELRPRLANVYEVYSPQKYFSFEESRWKSLLWTAKYAWLSFVKIVSLHRQGVRFDLISTHFSLEAFIARFVYLVTGTPYSLIQAGDTDFELLEGKFAQLTIQISKFMAKECRLYGYYPLILPKGIDKNRFNPKVKRSWRKRLLDKPDKQKLVVTVCRLDPRKNLETLIRASALVKKKDQDIKFAIAGDGVEKEKLAGLIKELHLEDTVFLVGSIPNLSEELPQFYASGDLFALPTLYEGFGWVYAEAMACGVPILSTRTSAVVETVGGVGELVPLKDPPAFAGKILEILGEEEKRQQMIVAGFKRVEGWYWENLLPRYEDAFLQASQQRKSPVLRMFKFVKDCFASYHIFPIAWRYLTNKSQEGWGPKKK